MVIEFTSDVRWYTSEQKKTRAAFVRKSEARDLWYLTSSNKKSLLAGVVLGGNGSVSALFASLAREGSPSDASRILGCSHLSPTERSAIPHLVGPDVCLQDLRALDLSRYGLLGRFRGATTSWYLYGDTTALSLPVSDLSDFRDILAVRLSDDISTIRIAARFCCGLWVRHAAGFEWANESAFLPTGMMSVPLTAPALACIVQGTALLGRFV